MTSTDTSRSRFRVGALRLPALLFGLMLLLTACVVTVPTPFGDVTFVICDYGDFPLEGIEVEIGGTVKTTDENGFVEFGTVQLPFTANIYDETSNYIVSYQNVDETDLRLFLPYSNDGNTDGNATFTGTVNPLGGGNHTVQVGATVDERAFPGTVDDTTLGYDVDARFAGFLDVNYDMYALEAQFDPDPDLTPGAITNLAAGFGQGTIGDGDNLNLDLDVLAHPQGTLIGNVTNPSGMDYDSLNYAAMFGSTAMDAFVPFLILEDTNPSATFTLPTLQAPAGWSTDFAIVNRFSNAQGQEAAASTTGLDFDSSVIDVFPAQLGAAFIGYRDGDTFREGDTVNVGSLVQDTSVSLRFEPESASDPRLWIFSDSANLTIPDLDVFNISLSAGAAYRARTIRYSWSFAALLSKLADPYTLTKGISVRQDLTTLFSAERDVTVGGGGGGGGATPPTSLAYYPISIGYAFEGVGVVRSGTPVSDLQLPGAISTQAASCPNIVMAAAGGSVVVEACGGDVVQDYTGGATNFFEAMVLPTPAGGSGLAALFEAGGSGYFLAGIAPNGSIGFGMVPPPGAHFFYDAQPIGGDPVNGAVFTDFGLGTIDFVTYDDGTDAWTISGDDTIALADIDDGSFVYGTRSAAVNAAGDELLLIGQQITAPNGFALLHVTLDGPVGLRTQAASVATVVNVAALGSDPRRIRCDLAAERCAVADFTDSTLTVVSWDGSGAPAVVGNANVASGPVGIGVLGDHIVSAGFNDDQFSVVTLNGDGSVAGVSTTALPDDCDKPGHAVFLDDPGNAALVSCNGDGTTPGGSGFVYIPNAF
jgi:hypothetical protein